MQPIVLGFALAFAGMTGAASATQQTPSPPPQAQQPAHKVFVLNGCLTSRPGAADAFHLTGATPVGQAPPERPVSDPALKGVYVLLPTTGFTEQGVPRSEMEPHVGRKVEVTVRPVEVAPGPAPSSSSAAASTEQVAEATPPRYTVVKIASATGSCPRV